MNLQVRPPMELFDNRGAEIHVKEEVEVKEEILETSIEDEKLIVTDGLVMEDPLAPASTSQPTSKKRKSDFAGDGKMAQDSYDVVSRKQLSTQSRMVVLNVYHYFRRQDERECETDVKAKTAAATGVSVGTVYRIKKHGTDVIERPSPPRSRIATVLGKIDDFNEECIRREIMSFYERGEIPTLVTLLEKMKEPPVNFAGCKTSLNTLIKKLGFYYKRIQGGRHILMERNDVVAARNRYLRLINENRKCTNPRPEIYLGETWINQNECVGKCRTEEDGAVGPKLKNEKGAGFIIVHAGGEDGFVPGALLVLKSKNGNKGDYRQPMNSECFRSWFQDQLLPSIPHHSLIVMDNTSYHSKLTNKAPTRCSRKCDVIEWLTYNNIAHDPSNTKAELLQIATSQKDKHVYEIDQIAHENGHEVVRLPPYNCRLNPVELIWAQIKSEIKKEYSNCSQTMKQVGKTSKSVMNKMNKEDWEKVEEISRSVINEVSNEDWRKCICQTRDIEEDYRNKDRAAEDLLENYVTDLNDTSDSDEYE